MKKIGFLSLVFFILVSCSSETGIVTPVANPSPVIDKQESPMVQPKPLPASQNSVDFVFFSVGTVFDNEGRPVENAMVTTKMTQIIPYFYANKLLEVSARTNAKGEYKIPYSSGGSDIIVSAHKEGYEGVNVKITQPARIQTVDFGGPSNRAFPSLKTDVNPPVGPMDGLDFLPSFTGTVFDTEGKPLADATLTIISKVIIPSLNPDKLFEYSVKTNDKGQYRLFYPGEVSEFIFSASKNEYTPISVIIKPEKGQVFNFGGPSASSFPSLDPCEERCFFSGYIDLNPL
jgi:hypothetical protein